MDHETTSTEATSTKVNRPGIIASWGPVLLVVGLLGLYFVTSRPSLPPEGWGEDYHQALEEAARTHRQVVVDFYMEGCPPCAAMDRTVLRTPEVRASLDGFIPVRVDVNRDYELANRYGVYATPTYAVLDADERIVAKCEGMQTAEAFVQFLARAANVRTTASLSP